MKPRLAQLTDIGDERDADAALRGRRTRVGRFIVAAAAGCDQRHQQQDQEVFAGSLKPGARVYASGAPPRHAGRRLPGSGRRAPGADGKRASLSRAVGRSPGGYLEPGETLEGSIRRHLAAKVDVRELRASRAARDAERPRRNPRQWELATAYLGLVPADLDPRRRTPPGIPLVLCRRPRSITEKSVEAGSTRLRAKLSYTNIAFALAPDVFTLSELRALYVAALGRDVSATNLQRVLLRREAERTGSEARARESGRPAGGALPLPRAGAGGDGPVRGPQTAALSEPVVIRTDHGEDRNHNGDQHTHAAEDERRRASLSPRRLATSGSSGASSGPFGSVSRDDASRQRRRIRHCAKTISAVTANMTGSLQPRTRSADTRTHSCRRRAADRSSRRAGDPVEDQQRRDEVRLEAEDRVRKSSRASAGAISGRVTRAKTYTGRALDLRQLEQVVREALPDGERDDEAFADLEEAHQHHRPAGVVRIGEPLRSRGADRVEDEVQRAVERIEDPEREQREGDVRHDGRQIDAGPVRGDAAELGMEEESEQQRPEQTEWTAAAMNISEFRSERRKRSSPQSSRKFPSRPTRAT